jgi:hypothetical protein
VDAVTALLDELVSWLREQVAADRQRAEELARDPFEGMTDDELHYRHMHPAFEYRITEGQRKAWPYADDPPEPDVGWELNRTSNNPDAWQRLDYTEERYWRRIRPAGPIIERRPSSTALDLLAQCEADMLLIKRWTEAHAEYPAGSRAYDYESEVGRARTSTFEEALRIRASAFQHRPGYRQEWRPCET